MKTPKCPLCGKDLILEKLLTETEDKYFCRAKCTRCHWITEIGRTSEKRAWQDAEEFISKFPPIMRIQPGDNVRISFSSDVHTVVYTNLESMKIYLQDCHGEIDSCYPSLIDRWPWELGENVTTKSCGNCKYCYRPDYKSPCLECTDCEDEAYKYWEPEQKGGSHED